MEDPDVDAIPGNNDSYLCGAVHLGIQSSTPRKDTHHTDFFPDLDCSIPSSISVSDTKTLIPTPAAPVPEAPCPVPAAAPSVRKLMLKRRETRRKLKPGFKSKLPKEPIVVEDYQVKNPPPPLWMPEFGLYMTDRDILLTPDQWLTDSIVDAAQDLIKRINPAIGGLQRVCCGLTMAFMVEPDEFLQIVGTGNGHWILISTVGTKHPTVLVYDSVYYTVSTFVERQIAAMLCSQEKEIPLHFINTQMQYGSADCGLFAIAFATAIALGISPEYIHFQQGEMRQHLLTCLSNGKLTMFPFDKNRRAKKRIKVTQIIKLFVNVAFLNSGR